MMMVTLTLVVFRSFLVRASGSKLVTLFEEVTNESSFHCIVLGGTSSEMKSSPLAIPSTSHQSGPGSHYIRRSRTRSESIDSGISLSPIKPGRMSSGTPVARPVASVVEGSPGIVISTRQPGFIPETGGTTPQARKTAQLRDNTILVEVGNVRYHVQQYVGKGKTGFVFRAVAVDDNAIPGVPQRKYVLKFSQPPARGPKERMRNEVIYDFNTMQMLKRDGYRYVPKAIAMGYVANDGYQWSVVTAVEYIGHDMYYERNQLSQQGYAFSEEDTLWYAIKLKDALRELHDTHHMVHRDIKLANILVKKSPHSERAEDHELFLIDFGTAMRYVTDAGMHVPATYQRNRQGSQQYVSVRVINHKLGGRQDDMHAALLAVLEMKQYLTAAEALERGAQFGANIANFDRAWAGKMAEPRRKVPQALRDLWDMTYNPSLEDTSKWQERPNYELWDRKLRDALTELRV
eukprot:GEMP01013204.1.p1 GENE.GEMP01013204.1~~GEMP01013204.1.p1  ORF type:complete len:461 (+),score=96.32 GEMP01013204.1:204-1586(+)